MGWKELDFTACGRGRNTEDKKKDRASSCLQKESKGKFPPQPLGMILILTAEMRPWDHCPSSTALAGMAPT